MLGEGGILLFNTRIKPMKKFTFPLTPVRRKPQRLTSNIRWITAGKTA